MSLDSLRDLAQRIPEPTVAWSDTASIKRIDGTKVFILRAPLSYTDIDGTIYTVLPQMQSDGASIPRIVQWWVGSPIAGEYLEAAILHDAMCRSGMFSIEFCDEVMERAMRAHGVPEETINAISAGLRIARAWRRQRPVDPAAGDYLAVTHARKT